MTHLKIQIPPQGQHEAREQWMMTVLRAVLDEHSQGAAQKARFMVAEALGQLMDRERP